MEVKNEGTSESTESDNPTSESFVGETIPTEELVRGELAKRHRPAAKAIRNLDLTVTARQSVGSDFRIAASELENRLGLLFPELPPSKE